MFFKSRRFPYSVSRGKARLLLQRDSTIIDLKKIEIGFSLVKQLKWMCHVAEVLSSRDHSEESTSFSDIPQFSAPQTSACRRITYGAC